MYTVERLRQHFAQFLRKQGLVYTHRRSTESHYYEVHMGRTVILVRISTHEHTAGWHQWQPDVNVTDNRSFREAKQAVKDLARQQGRALN